MFGFRVLEDLSAHLLGELDQVKMIHIKVLARIEGTGLITTKMVIVKVSEGMNELT